MSPNRQKTASQRVLCVPKCEVAIPRPHSPRPLFIGRTSSAFGRPTPIQPFPNPDMDGINRHATTSQPSFGSNTRTTRFRLNLPTSLIRQLQPILKNNSTSTQKNWRKIVRSESFASEVKPFCFGYPNHTERLHSHILESGHPQVRRQREDGTLRQGGLARQKALRHETPLYQNESPRLFDAMR